MSNQNDAAFERTGVKVLHVLAIITTTCASTYLVITRDKLYSGSFVGFVKSNRASIQIFVQLLSHGLASLQLYNLRSLLNFGSRLSLQKHKVSLNKLSFWAALSNGRIDWSLPIIYILWTVFASASLLIPGAIWAGALSPITTPTLRSNGTIETPAYDAQSANVWDAEFQLRYHGADVELWNLITSCHTPIYDRRGFIPACPVPALQGSLLLSASSATTVDGSPRLHSKLDNNQWTFIGRSYGVGSSVALATAQIARTESGVQTYTYNETGYLSKVDCIKNSSSDIAFVLGEQLAIGDHPVVYFLTGSLPNEAPGTNEFFPVTSFHTDYGNLLAWAARSLSGRSIISIASGVGNYTQLNQTQCEVTFIATIFTVLVNTTARSIIVQPTTLDATDIEPTGHLTTNVINSINLLSRMSNTLYVSVLGNSLQQNVLNKQLQLNLTNEETTDNVVTTAMEDSFSAIIDDILVAYGASQIVISSDTTLVPTVAFANAVRIGDPIYQYITFAINTLFILASIFEAFRTRLWRGLLRIDYTSTKSVIITASAGGPGLAQIVSERCKQTDAKVWLGSDQDPVLTDVDVSLGLSKSVPHMLAIINADSDVREEAAMHLVRRKPLPSPDIVELHPFHAPGYSSSVMWNE